jgi:hypothetical protein
MSDKVAKAFEEFLRTRRDHRDGLTAKQQLWTAFEAGAQFTLDEIRERTGLAEPAQEMLPIPDFLRNQDNLRAERAAQETRPAHTAAHDCACADCVKAETPAVPTEHAVYGGRIMTLRECMEAEETPTLLVGSPTIPKVQSRTTAPLRQALEAIAENLTESFQPTGDNDE